MNGMSDSLKAALWTALFTFVGTVLIAFVPLLEAVGDWIVGDDANLADDWSAFSRVIVSAFLAAVSGLVNWAVRALQARQGVGSVPSYN